MRIPPIVAVTLGLAACRSGPSRPGPLPPLEAPGPSPAQHYTRLELGTARGHATRTAFVLVFDGEHATLTETYDRDARSVTLAEADREPRWALAGTQRYRGTRRPQADGVELELEASGAQPLLLHCTHRTLEVAAAGARPRADPIAPCERRGWDPPATTPTQVLVCSAAGQDASDADPDDQLVFGPGPGVEWVDENDGCATRAGGLRAAG